jgi:hypothetical protein
MRPPRSNHHGGGHHATTNIDQRYWETLQYARADLFAIAICQRNQDHAQENQHGNQRGTQM